MNHLSRRRVVLGAGAVGLGLLAGCGRLPGQAQPSTKVARIGVLSQVPTAGILTSLDTFRQGLQDLGYVEGQDISIEYRSADGDPARLPALATELVKFQVDVIVAVAGLEAPGAARDATSTIPIVMVTPGDPVRMGLVASLGRPGGNVTGLTQFAIELAPKRFELLKETLPGIARVVYFYDRRQHELEAAAEVLGVHLQRVEVPGPDEYEAAFDAAARWRADALLHNGGAFAATNRSRIIALAAQRRLPAIYYAASFVRDGGLMAYAASATESYRRAANYVDRILKGAKPADLPVEQPMRFDFVINLRTAEALGLSIPHHVLLQATEVIQ
jgi:putative tryptophan/tyrosine transport system substrate-binding protein